MDVFLHVGPTRASVQIQACLFERPRDGAQRFWLFLGLHHMCGLSQPNVSRWISHGIVAREKSALSMGIRYQVLRSRCWPGNGVVYSMRTLPYSALGAEMAVFQLMTWSSCIPRLGG